MKTHVEGSCPYLHHELSQLWHLVLEARDSERHRIARDLHDGVTQSLVSAAFRIGAFRTHVPTGNAEARAELEHIRLHLVRAIDEIQTIAQDLCPAELDALGLVSALRNLCQECQRNTGLTLEFDSRLHVARLPAAMELTLYRIAQEALNNVIKHSRASRATLHLVSDDSLVQLTVRDNGWGLKPGTKQSRRSKKGGMGLRNMRERAAFLGGSCTIRSEPAQGTEITATVPFATEGSLAKVA